MAARNSGTKLVVGAVSLTVAALGVSTIYLPYYADRDRIRGLNEESDLTASEKREYEKMMALLRKKQEEGEPTGVSNGNSMWKQMNSQAAARK